MEFDDKKKVLPTRTGHAIGDAAENRLIDNAGGPNTIVTRIRKFPDGSTTRLKTRGGFPEFVSEKKRIPVATTRTFVFRHLGAATGVIANKLGAGMKVLNDAFDIGTDISYWVGKLATDVQGFWKDVFRRDGTAINKNAVSPTPVISTVSVGSTRSVPVVVSNAAYAATCNGAADRSTLFVVDEGVKQIISTKPDGTLKSSITAASAAIYDDAGIAGRCMSLVEGRNYIDVVFATSHKPRLDSNPMNAAFYQSSMTKYMWEKLRISSDSPYLYSVSTSTEDATTFLSNPYTNTTSSGFTGGSIPSNLHAGVVRQMWQVLPAGAVGYVFNGTYTPFTSTRNEFSTFETSRTYLPATVSYMLGSGFGVTVSGSCSGTNTATGGAGRVFMTYNAEPEENVYAGHSAHTLFNMTSTVTVTGETCGEMFRRVDTCVAEAASTEETVRVNLTYVEPTSPPGGSTYVGDVEDYIAPWEYQSTYEQNPLQSAKTGSVNIIACDYAFFDPVEQIGVGLMCEVHGSYSVQSYSNGPQTAFSFSGTIKISKLVHVRGVNKTSTYWEDVYPIVTSVPTTLAPAWPNPFFGLGALAIPNIGVVDYSAAFSTGYQRNTLGGIATFSKHPIFAPTYTNQGFCKYVAHTTKEEEFRGAAAELYVDMKVSPKRPMDFTQIVPEVLGEGIPFMANNITNALFGLSADATLCYNLWETIFPSYQPVTVQFANGEFGNWQSKLGPGFTGNPPLEITRI